MLAQQEYTLMEMVHPDSEQTPILDQTWGFMTVYGPQMSLTILGHTHGEALGSSL